MRPVEEPFKAKASNFWETMTSHSGNAGFRLPDYQRKYDWSYDNIRRLLEDCLNGFYFLSRYKQESYTFLGTIILVEETSESSFDGRSLSIVDGQQRLTTLILVCCALIEELLLRQEDVRHLREPTADWVKVEIEYIRESLFSCVVGHLQFRGRTFPFPRVVRSLDYRAREPRDAEYRSAVARFLETFAVYYQKEEDSFYPEITGDATGGDQYLRNYDYIRRQVHLGIYGVNDTSDENQQSDVEHEQIENSDFGKVEMRNMFEKLDALSSQEEKNRAINDIVATNESSGLIRLILFSYYLLKCVVLTRVETRDEDSAFDIFDALNTTGEPLTAIETFKPRVIRFENEERGYPGSNSESHITRLERHLDEIYPESEKRQKSTKELLVSFALYLEGRKLPLDLASQRNYLRSTFEGRQGKEPKRRLVQSLADIAEFRHIYWDRDSIANLNVYHSEEVSDLLKLCLYFLAEMNTSLCIPILARYWVHWQQEQDDDLLVGAAKALTAFIVLRRSVTGNTRRIDTDFRKIMKGEPQRGNMGLCMGLDHSKALLGLDDLRGILRGYLASSSIGVNSKQSWVSRASEVGLADYSRSLCRFLLFAASHDSRPQENQPGLLTREGIRSSEELSFLTFTKWRNVQYATLEHVAPDSNVGSGWGSDIYDKQVTRHKLGNLILLPQKENSSVGNAPWVKKKMFYGALAAKTDEERNAKFEEARGAGLDFKKETKNLVEKQGRLHMLDPIVNVNKWTESFIQKRTNNTLELAWDAVSPWLEY